VNELAMPGQRRELEMTLFVYYAFLIKAAGRKIAFYTGTLFLHNFRLKSLIATSEWACITDMFITRGDPAH
jgi:hypothetical protein